MTSIVNRLRALAVDNPVLEKEASLALRSRLAWVAVLLLGLGTLLAVVVAHLGEEPGHNALVQWGTLDVSGRVMFATAVGIALGLSSLVLPALAIGSLAGERERGTLSLLIGSALSPSRIVAGKMLGLLAIAAPAFIVFMPMLAVASVFGGVELWHAVGAVILLVVHGTAILAVSLAGSAYAKRTRTAATFVMLVGQLPGLVAGIAGVATLAHYVDYDDATRVAGPLLLGGVIDILLIFTGLFLAWDQLAPKRAPRARLRDLLLVGFVFAIPAFAGLLQLALPSGYGAREDALVAMFFQAGIVSTLAMLVAVTTSDRVVGEGREPWKQALLCAVLVTAGVFVARALPLDAARPALRSITWLSTIYLALYAVFIGATAAAFSRFVKAPLARIGLTIGFHAALFIGSIVAHEAHRLIGLDREAFMWMNVVGMVEAIERTHRDYVSLGFGFVFVGTALSMVIAARGRSSCEPRPTPNS